MFDVSFSELLVIALVALIVIGPERLPKTARIAGLLMGRARRYVQNIKQEVQQEIQLEELRELRDHVAQSAQELEASMRQEFQETGEMVSDLAQEAREALHVTDEQKQSGESFPPALSPASETLSPVTEATAITTATTGDAPPAPSIPVPIPVTPASTTSTRASPMSCS